jgi:hypothetical protein
MSINDCRERRLIATNGIPTNQLGIRAGGVGSRQPT